MGRDKFSIVELPVRLGLTRGGGGGGRRSLWSPCSDLTLRDLIPVLVFLGACLNPISGCCSRVEEVVSWTHGAVFGGGWVGGATKGLGELDIAFSQRIGEGEDEGAREGTKA